MKRIALLCVALAACGKTGAIQTNNAGTGSGTLFVSAAADTSNQGGLATLFTVTLEDATSATVSGATVVVHNQDWGDISLGELSAGSGIYFGYRLGSSNSAFGLDVSHPTKGSVTGVVVANPGMQAIEAPKSGTAVPAGQPLQVSWSKPATAGSAALRTNNLAEVVTPDTGSYTIPAASNPANTSQQLDLRRYNEVDIAGALPGSKLTVTSRARVGYSVQ